MIPLRQIAHGHPEGVLHWKRQQSHASSVIRCFSCKPTVNLTFSLRTSGRNGTFVLYSALRWDFLQGAQTQIQTQCS